MKASLLLKTLLIGFLILILLIPLQMVHGVVREREERRHAAIAEIASKWGGSQTLVGPTLVVPYRLTWRDKDGVPRTRIERIVVLPDSLKLDGELVPERRRRGLFEAVIYRLDLKVSGRLPQPDLAGLAVAPEDVLWSDAFLAFGIPDTRGLKEKLALTWDGKPVAFRPGPASAGLFPSGIHAPLPGLSEESSGPHTFSFGLSLNGSEALQVAPLGVETEVNLRSIWPSPSFVGAFLPDRREIGTNGFHAAWKVSHFGRSYPQTWKTDCLDENARANALVASAFGVRFFLPADFYQQTVRSLKYGVLFIVLTFLLFFLFELFSGLRLHPLHYLLVGFALSLFYLLLLSGAEQIGFPLSYLSAAAATIALISGYSASILAAKGRALLVGGALSVLYGYLYVLLQLEDYSLLLGSIALFLILAAVMYATRKIDWYGVSGPASPPAPPRIRPSVPPPPPPAATPQQPA